MIEDELIVRHVSLCVCGKVAGHRGVCFPERGEYGPGRYARVGEDERVPADWEEEHARNREATHARNQSRFRSQRIMERSVLTLRELQALADVREAKLSPIAAANIAPSHGASGHPSVNLALRAGSVDLGQDPRWRAADQRERAAVLRKHELLDEYEGLGVAQAERELTSEEIDAEIVSPANRDQSAGEYARAHPGHGAPSTIARKRRWFDQGLCTFSGLQPPRPSCRCPTCRLVST